MNTTNNTNTICKFCSEKTCDNADTCESCCIIISDCIGACPGCYAKFDEDEDSTFCGEHSEHRKLTEEEMRREFESYM